MVFLFLECFSVLEAIGIVSVNNLKSLYYCHDDYSFSCELQLAEGLKQGFWSGWLPKLSNTGSYVSLKTTYIRL